MRVPVPLVVALRIPVKGFPIEVGGLVAAVRVDWAE